MTPQEIRDAITAAPELQALVPDTVALAAALSVGRTRVVKTLDAMAASFAGRVPSVALTY